MVLFCLFFLLCDGCSIKNKGSHWVFFFFYLHTTIRLKHVILFHLLFLFARAFDQKLGSSLIYLFYLCTTIQPKLGAKIYYFLNCADTLFTIFMTVLPLCFALSVSGSISTLQSWQYYLYISSAIFIEYCLILCTQYSQKCWSYISDAIFMSNWSLGQFTAFNLSCLH